MPRFATTLATWLMGVSVAWLPAFALVGGLALSNLGCLLWARSARRVPAAALGALILADTLLLSAALALSGGAHNPFVTLYVIEVTLAALLVSVPWVMAVGAASVAGYALLLASLRGRRGTRGQLGVAGCARPHPVYQRDPGRAHRPGVSAAAGGAGSGPAGSGAGGKAGFR